jgi:hypothetical protein
MQKWILSRVNYSKINSEMKLLLTLFALVAAAFAAEVLTRDGSIVLQVALGKSVNIATDPTTISTDNMVVTMVGLRVSFIPTTRLRHHHDVAIARVNCKASLQLPLPTKSML